MPKKKKKKKKKSFPVKIRSLEELVKTEGQEYALVTEILGNCRLRVTCTDGKKRIGHIRGKMKKRVWITRGDYVLVSLRDFQDEKADIIMKYKQDEVEKLKKYNEIPSDQVETEEVETVEVNFEDI